MASVQPGSPATPPAARPTSTSATRPCRSTATAASSSSTTARRPPAGTRRSRARRSTNKGVTWSARRSPCRRPARTPRPRRVESRGNGDVRAWYYETRAAATTTPGTSGTALGRRRRDLDRAGQDLGCDPAARPTRRRTASSRSTATTARSRSRARQDDRDLGRGPELHGPGRRLDQPASHSPGGLKAPGAGPRRRPRPWRSPRISPSSGCSARRRP